MNTSGRHGLFFSLCSLLFASSMAFLQPQASFLRPSRLSAGAICVPRASCTHSMAPRMSDVSAAEGGRAGRRSVLSDAARLLVLGGLAVGGGALPAAADMTLNRRIRLAGKGRDLYVLGLLRAIEADDWDTVVKLFDATSVSQEGSEKEVLGLAIKATELQRTLFSPMEVFTTAFEEKGTGPKQRKMSKSVAKMEASCNAIREAAGAEGGAVDKEAALAAWETTFGDTESLTFRDTVSLNVKACLLQVGKLEGIQDAVTYVKTPARPNNTYSYTGKATMLESYQGQVPKTPAPESRQIAQE
ncbi:hypothetical protein T484DRAFT_1930569 [Baffinella frigidus]|nr:hypothetical protein T484DRAFT_1930569 [Cryptophyta sp. CCMP2293]